MSVVDDRLRQMREVEANIFAAQRAADDRLKGGGGGGTSGGMEARVAKLESDMEHVKALLVRVDGKLDTLLGGATDTKASLATLVERTNDATAIRTAVHAATTKIDVLDERTKHLPSKTFIWVCVAGISAVVGVISRLIPFA